MVDEVMTDFGEDDRDADEATTKIIDEVMNDCDEAMEDSWFYA